MTHPLYVLGTGIAAGLTATTLAVASADFLGETPALAFWIGVAVVGLIGSVVLLIAKKWVEQLVIKVFELPPKREIFDAIGRGIEQANTYHAATLREIAGIREDFNRMNTRLSERIHELELTTTGIEMRHETEDRIKAGGLRS